MSRDRRGLRGVVLVEDKRTERFIRSLLNVLGFEKRAFRFKPDPSGKGDAKRWIRRQYPGEVKALRSKNYQRLALVVVRDGDEEGIGPRKADLNDALREAELEPRSDDERIAAPVPCWSIETWLLALLGDEITEDESLKHLFEQKYPANKERSAIRQAATAWREESELSSPLSSLVDGKTEMERLDVP